MQHTTVLTSVLFLLVLPAISLAQEEGKEGKEDYSYYGDYYYEDSTCEQESFYCDYDDPTVFYRCIDGIFHTFHCPAGLHFSVGTQTCDWPHLADCSGSEGHVEVSSGNYVEGEGAHDYGSGAEESHGSSQSTSHGSSQSSSHSSSQTNSVSHHQEAGKGFGHSGGSENMWISQAAASGNSWWRPEGGDPKQWEDASIKKPEFRPHVPDSKESESESAPKKSENTKASETKKSGTEPKKSGTEPKKSGTEPKKTAGAGEPNRKSSADIQWNEGSCSSSCQLPHCHCAGTSIPNGLSASSTPQMVMLTFDDEVSASFYGYFQRLFRPGRYNPNGCPVRGCLFVSGSGTDYDLVYPLYAMGVEIASHSISHRFPHTWWSSASYQEYVEEAAGMRENLVTRSNIPAEAIKGFRVPFLQLGGDSMYGALYDSKYQYDTSMFTGQQWEGGDPVWPFTLDYVPGNTYCQHGPCPTKQYPGMWEIPVQRWYGLDGHSCAMADGCSATGDSEETLEFLKSNFRRYYNSNRAPLGLFVHARWFNTEHNLEGLDKFVDYLLTLDDVYIVTPSQVIEWMKKPTPLGSINGFQPWSCEGGAKDVWLENH